MTHTYLKRTGRNGEAWRVERDGAWWVVYRDGIEYSRHERQLAAIYMVSCHCGMQVR